MDKAKRLLRETKKSVVEVALDVGYADPSHFAQLFHRATGLSQSDYRRQRWRCHTADADSFQRNLSRRNAIKAEDAKAQRISTADESGETRIQPQTRISRILAKPIVSRRSLTRAETDLPQRGNGN